MNSGSYVCIPGGVLHRRTNAPGKLVLLASLVAFSVPLVAQNTDDKVLDEIVVEGARKTLGELRRNLVQIEDQFYRR